MKQRPQQAPQRCRTEKRRAYRNVSLSMYFGDLAEADRLAAALRRLGWPTANRSLVFRDALRQLQDALAGKSEEEVFQFSSCVIACAGLSLSDVLRRLKTSCLTLTNNKPIDGRRLFRRLAALRPVSFHPHRHRLPRSGRHPSCSLCSAFNGALHDLTSSRPSRQLRERPLDRGDLRTQPTQRDLGAHTSELSQPRNVQTVRLRHPASFSRFPLSNGTAVCNVTRAPSA
jgi:hypothetical protein